MTIDDWRVRYDGLNAEADRLRAEAADLRKRLDVALFLVDALRARVTPEVIGEKHKDGNWWLLWGPWEAWIKGRRDLAYWRATDGLLTWEPTHALPLPPAPEVNNEGE